MGRDTSPEGAGLSGECVSGRQLGRFAPISGARGDRPCHRSPDGPCVQLRYTPVMQLQGTFVGCLVDAQDLNTKDDSMISRIDFVVVGFDGRENPGQLIVKQVTGGSFAGDPIEVSPPENYTGPGVDYSQLRGLAEKYYRSLVGSEGTGLRVAKDAATDVRMRNCRVSLRVPFTIDATTGTGGGW